MLEKTDLISRGYEFLWYSYFRTSYDKLSKNPNKAIKVCVERAYLDVNRTLTFNTDCKEKRSLFHNTVCEIITAGIKEKILNCNKEVFDDKHNEICDDILLFCNNYPENESEKVLGVKGDDNIAFHYGQAQKWLNMTLKYMMIMGFWTDKLNPIEDVVHVPVDSIIMEAAYLKLDVKLPRSSGSNYGKYSSSSKPWSKWDKPDYTKFQSDLRTAIRNKHLNETPIEWEFLAWIEVAQKRK